jgi:hypothetical protein
MKYIVESQKQDKQEKNGPGHYVTMCVLCSEHPRYCDKGDGPDPL